MNRTLEERINLNIPRDGRAEVIKDIAASIIRPRDMADLDEKNLLTISIITVVKNARETIRKTIESVLSQTYGAVEYIIVDGASTDGTLDIIREYGSRIRKWISEVDDGVYYGMNKALKLATGDFLIVLGANDCLYNKTVLSNVVRLIRDPSCIYYGNAYFVNRKIFYDGAFTKWKLIRENICHQAILYPRVVYKQNAYSVKYPLLADYEYNLRHYKLGMEYIPVVIASYLDQGMSLSKPDHVFKKDFPKIILRNLGPVCVFYFYFRRILRIYSKLKGAWKRNERV
jgi:glycosyltransferase involved in cell wall biosynthesis